MTKRLRSKYKLTRRLGENLWGRPKSPVNIREYGPGEHGQRRRKPSDYGIQLSAKQRLRGYYGNITEKQVRRTYHEAVRRRGDTSDQPTLASRACRGSLPSSWSKVRRN